MLACTIDGHHAEPVQGYCLNSACLETQGFCIRCLRCKHSNHLGDCKSVRELRETTRKFIILLKQSEETAQNSFQQFQMDFKKTQDYLTGLWMQMIELQNKLDKDDFLDLHFIKEKLIIIDKFQQEKIIKESQKLQDVLNDLNKFIEEFQSTEKEQNYQQKEIIQQFESNLQKQNIIKKQNIIQNHELILNYQNQQINETKALELKQNNNTQVSVIKKLKFYLNYKQQDLSIAEQYQSTYLPLSEPVIFYLCYPIIEEGARGHVSFQIESNLIYLGICSADRRNCIGGQADLRKIGHGFYLLDIYGKLYSNHLEKKNDYQTPFRFKLNHYLSVRIDAGNIVWKQKYGQRLLERSELEVKPFGGLQFCFGLARV